MAWALAATLAAAVGPAAAEATTQPPLASAPPLPSSPAVEEDSSIGEALMLYSDLLQQASSPIHGELSLAGAACGACCACVCRMMWLPQ